MVIKIRKVQKREIVYYNIFILIGYLSYSLSAGRMNYVFTMPDISFCRWDDFMLFSPGNFIIFFYFLSLCFINYSAASILALVSLLLVSHSMTISIYSVVIIAFSIISFFLLKQQGKWAIVLILLASLLTGYIEHRFMALKSLGLNDIGLQLLSRSTIKTYEKGAHFFIYQLPFTQTNWRDIAHRHDFVKTDKKAFLEAIDSDNKAKIVNLLNQKSGIYYRRINNSDHNSFTWAMVNEDTISIVTVN